MQIIGLFCKRDLSKRRYSAKVTYNVIDATDRSRPIGHEEIGRDSMSGPYVEMKTREYAEMKRVCDKTVCRDQDKCQKGATSNTRLGTRTGYEVATVSRID